MAGALFVVCLPKGLLDDGPKCNSPLPEGGVQITVTEAPTDGNGDDSPKDRTRNILKVSKKMAPKVDPRVPMETLLLQLLERAEVNNAVWNTVKNGKFFQVTFSVEAGDKCEECIKRLNECGFGVRPQTSVSVIPCTLFYRGYEGKSDVIEAKSVDDMEKGLTFTSSGKEKANGKLIDDPRIWNWEKFMASVRARLTVAEVVGSVRANAELTFDFVMLLIVAGMVAAMGLVENSSVSVVASMLISPLMGPILAGTFGIVVHDKQLKKIGVINELIGLVLCILVGFIYGLVIGFSSDTYRYSDPTMWPTSEMISRGQIATLWVGCLIALPSGAGVALGILGGNVSSLVGVAISASLLPPAVNAGIFWALALVKAVISNEDDVSSTVPYIYFTEKHLDYAVLGAVSLCLTIINIICIFVAGVLVLKVKEVAPQTNNEELRQFWQHDIRVARDYNRTLQGENASDVGRQLLKKLSVSRNIMEEAKHEIGGFSTPRHVSESGSVPHHKESVVSMNSSNNQFSWTSGNMHQRYMFHPRFHQKSNSGPSEEELERVVYSTLTADSKRGLLSGLGIIGVTGQSSKRKISSMSLPGNSHHLRSPKISTCVEPQLDTIREASTNLTGEPETVLVSQSNRRFHITPCTENKQS